MANQGESTADYIASHEKHQLNNSIQVHTISHVSPTSAVTSWNTQGENHSLMENRVLSSSSHNHGLQVDQNSTNAQNGANLMPSAPVLSSGPATVAQGYNNYTAYPNSDPYGYSSTGHTSYYNQYQQQPNHYQQQSNEYQQQANHYHQQPNQAYPHQVGAYQNTGAAYQPLSSFQNTGSYAAPTSYSGTYYNPADYQTSGSYTSSAYGPQTSLWHGGQYATYGSHQYTHYVPDSNSAYSSSTASTTSQYQQIYKQWEDYYNQTQTEVSCAPGTENVSVSTASGVNNIVTSGSSGYAASNNQVPAAYPHSWIAESSSSELTSVKPVAASGTAPEVYWKNGASSFQGDLPKPVQQHVLKPQEVIQSQGIYQNQQNSAFPQGSSALYPTSSQVSQSYQPTFPTASPHVTLDSQKANKLQIPTNPRIASNLPFNSSKPDKDSSMSSTATKPAYVSVPIPKPNEVVSNEGSDSMLKPGVFPNSLRGYVERALARCKNDKQKTVCQGIMKEVIKKATMDGTLHTKDWDTEPLFAMPNTDAINNQDSTFSLPPFAMPKSRSPSRRVKSRWEPIAEEKVINKSTNVSSETTKYGVWNNKQFSIGKIQSKDNLGTKFPLSSNQKSFGKNALRPTKRQRLGGDLSVVDGGESSSDSDKEQSLTKYYSAATALADSPEEKKKRESRSKRFDRGQGNRAEKNRVRVEDGGAGNSYARRASALILSRTLEESESNSVEDIDWDALTVKGTCQEIEKRYLRLTSAPDPATVRPEDVLEKALVMVQNSQKNYLYKCDQLKSIRQDLTVQRIRNELTVKVYETHARLAIEAGDLPEYNQCQSQLKTLYVEGISGCRMEFAAYNLLCEILHSNNSRDLLSAMSRLSADAKKDEAVKHALSVRTAVTSGNYVMFFRLYKSAPNLNAFFMDLYAEKMRYTAVKCIARSCRPTVPVSYLSQILGFTSTLLPTSETDNEKEVDGLECVEWLKAHGSILNVDGSGETLLDTKASVATLYMPEPEDAVSHGDANLAVNDFLTRALA